MLSYFLPVLYLAIAQIDESATRQHVHVVAIATSGQKMKKQCPLKSTLLN